MERRAIRVQTDQAVFFVIKAITGKGFAFSCFYVWRKKA
jgi:hypothetical protein